MATHVDVSGSTPRSPKPWSAHLVKYAASVSPDELRIVLEDIGDTRQSGAPPPDEAGRSHKRPKRSWTVRITRFLPVLHGAVRVSTAKILRIAKIAFAGIYDAASIRRVLELFYRRFFSQQFKRSCLPDGPKVGSVTLSPRGDWRMPSDAVAQVWLDDLDRAGTE
jgi:NAD+ synthase (glutamine-hydrolysing)